MRWMLLYRNGNGEGQSLIVNDTDGANLPHGDAADSLCRERGKDYNDGGGIFIVSLPDEGEPDVIDDASGEEVGRIFVDL